MSPTKPVYVLDSFALLAYLNGETGKERVEKVLSLAQSHQCRVLLCMINLGEVLYLTERHRGLIQAQKVLALVDSLPMDLIEPSRDLVLEAAHIKAQYTLSYADAFVIATSLREHGIVITGDPEFQEVESIIQVEWLVRE